MAESNKARQPGRAPHEADAAKAPQRRQPPSERVIEEGQDVQNNPRPAREKRGGTPLGSDPRE